MLLVSSLPYVILGVFGGFSVLTLISDRSNAFVTIFLNIIFGGALYIILNLCKITIPFNILTASCISILGFPGVVLLVILKLVFRIF